jgi:hypothetical protein
MRARGGTRTGLLPLQTLGSPENKGNPGQSGTGTAQFVTQSVDTVHTPISSVSNCRRLNSNADRFRKHLCPWLAVRT